MQGCAADLLRNGGASEEDAESSGDEGEEGAGLDDAAEPAGRWGWRVHCCAQSAALDRTAQSNRTSERQYKQSRTHLVLLLAGRTLTVRKRRRELMRRRKRRMSWQRAWKRARGRGGSCGGAGASAGCGRARTHS